MCGFVGFTGFLKDRPQTLAAMMDKIIHRGPALAGSYMDESVALGFRLLNLIDPEQGVEPLFNEDNTKVLVFDGRIYNYQSLRDELLERGHNFRTKGDSEVLLHGYEEYGKDFLNKLRGMFSFVIWDVEKKELFGARDFFGIKPFYYGNMGGSFFFGSEIKAFLPHPCFRKEVNLAALEHYLSFQYSPTEETFFEGVYKLPAAHCFFYRLEKRLEKPTEVVATRDGAGDTAENFVSASGKMEITRYWEPAFAPDHTKSMQDFREEIRATFADSINAHISGEIEVGAFLSSGIDSSYVASTARVDKTFTVGFEGDKYDELGYAKRFSEEVGLNNIGYPISPEEYWKVLPSIQYHMDEPLADASAVALYFGSREAAKNVKAVLSGEGADELFGGYKVYLHSLMTSGYKKIPRPLRACAVALLRILPESTPKHDALLNRLGKVEDWYLGNIWAYSTKQRRKIMKNPPAAPAVKDLTAACYQKVAGAADITKMQYLDLHYWLSSAILLKADKMSAAHSIELRTPFLDKEIMELAQRIPWQYCVTRENTKLVLRQAASDKLPEFTANKEKLGFPVPVRHWLFEDKYYEVIKEAFESDVAEKFFHVPAIMKVLDDYRAKKHPHYLKIWCVYMFIVWYRQFFLTE